jgi:hypothetical protein
MKNMVESLAPRLANVATNQSGQSEERLGSALGAAGERLNSSTGEQQAPLWLCEGRR